MFKRAVSISAVFFLFEESVAVRMEAEGLSKRLIEASYRGHEEIVRMLLAAGANPSGFQDKCPLYPKCHILPEAWYWAVETIIAIYGFYR